MPETFPVREMYRNILNETDEHTIGLRVRDLAGLATPDELVDLAVNYNLYPEASLIRLRSRHVASRAVLGELFKKTRDLRQVLALLVHPCTEGFFGYRHRSGSFLCNDLYENSFLTDEVSALPIPEQFDHVQYVIGLAQKQPDESEVYDEDFQRLACAMLWDIDISEDNDAVHLRNELSDAVLERRMPIDMDDFARCVRIMRTLVCLPETAVVS